MATKEVSGGRKNLGWTIYG